MNSRKLRLSLKCQRTPFPFLVAEIQLKSKLYATGKDLVIYLSLVDYFLDNIFLILGSLMNACGTELMAGFNMITDDRGSQIAESSAIVCDHMETHFCDLLRSCGRDRRRSQTIAEDRTMFYLLRSSAIICDRLRSCDHMETKVLRSAIEMYPIIFF